MKGILSLLLAFVLAVPAFAKEKRRIVCLGGTTTEIVFALGHEKEIVGVDVSSIYPERAAKLPQVGYWRGLSTEGILSLKPTHIVAAYDAGPESVIKQLKEAGIKVLKLNPEFTVAAAKKDIDAIAKFFKSDKKKAEKLKADIDNETKKAKEKISSYSVKPKALFLYIRGGKMFHAGGKGTPAEAMIELGGGENAANSVDGWKNITPEFFVQSDADVFIVTEHGLQSMGGLEKFKALPGIGQTKAVKNNNVLVVDDLAFLGFGPRLGSALRQLTDEFATLESAKPDKNKAKKK